MAVAIDTGNILTTTRNVGGSNPITVGSLTVGAGVNYVMVFVSGNGTLADDTCTVNGTSATLTVNGDSGGGYSDLAIFTLANPTSGSVSITLVNDRDVAITVVPFSGVDTGTPTGSWTSTAPVSTHTASPTTGTITGVDSSGLFIGALAILNAGSISSEGTGFSAVSGADASQGNIRIHVATAAGAASATYAPTIALNRCNITGVYVNAGVTTTKKLKLLAHSSAASATGVAGVVFAAPTGGAITGAEIGEFTGASFEASLESGQAVLKVAVADFGGSALTTSDTPVALVRNTTHTSGIISCTVIEE